MPFCRTLSAHIRCFLVPRQHVWALSALLFQSGCKKPSARRDPGPDAPAALAAAARQRETSPCLRPPERERGCGFPGGPRSLAAPEAPRAAFSLMAGAGVWLCGHLPVGRGARPEPWRSPAAFPSELRWGSAGFVLDPGWFRRCFFSLLLTPQQNMYSVWSRAINKIRNNNWKALVCKITKAQRFQLGLQTCTSACPTFLWRRMDLCELKGFCVALSPSVCSEAGRVTALQTISSKVNPARKWSFTATTPHETHSVCS